MSFFAVENLGVRFGGVVAVDGVSFSVNPGEVYTIIGPNGAGKTTIFNLIGLIYAPTSGRILFEGSEVTGAPHNVAERGIARTFQNIELFEHATVLQNLLIGRHRHRRTNLFDELLFLPSVRRAEIAQREAVERVIDLLDLQHYRDSLVAGLPYGVRKVVELGRALATEPKLMLLDEPSSGPQSGRDRRHGVLDRGHPEGARHHGADGRARHEPGLARLDPRARAQRRPRDRRRHAGGGAVASGGDRGVSWGRGVMTHSPRAPLCAPSTLSCVPLPPCGGGLGVGVASARDALRAKLRPPLPNPLPARGEGETRPELRGGGS